MSPISRRATNLRSFIVMDVLERARELERQGQNIIHLEIGEPDFSTPDCICEAAQEALANGYTHYTHSLGIIELREAISQSYHDKYGVYVSPDNIVITSGTSPALFMTLSTLLEAGDEVIMSDPHYPCYPNFVNFIGATPETVEVSEHEGFQLKAEEVKKKINARTKAIIINSPSNPTGNLLSKQCLEEIAELAVPVVSDEIYHGLVYGENEHCILEFTDKAFVFNGFSKLYAMTGWRLGYVIAPSEYVRSLQKIQQNLFISASSISQWAGVAALRGAASDVQYMREVYDKRRRHMVAELRELGFGIGVEPVGAFYILANAKHLSDSSYELAFEILEKAGVGVTPGIDFGNNAEGYLRFSYANSLENIREGLKRIGTFLEKGI